MSRKILIFIVLMITPFLVLAYKPGDKYIKGDADGSGKVTATDYIVVRKHILKQTTLKDDAYIRADVTVDNKITSLDYIAVRKMILNGKTREVVTVSGATLKSTATPTLKPTATATPKPTNTPILISKIKLNKNNVTLSKEKTETLKLNIIPNNATNKEVVWTSSNPKIATVDKNGKIKAIKAGNATITVATKDGSKKASCKVSVNEQYLGWNQKMADKKFGPILAGLFTGKTKETIVNTKIGKKISMHFSDMAYVNGVIYAYYICSSGYPNRHATCLATSNDGIKFEDKGRVIMPDADYDYSRASFAGVWFENNTFYLVYEALGKTGRENIALATSKDGINWTKKGIILYKNENLSWQTGNIGTPDLYKVNDTWYLTFHGFNRDDCQIGVAYGTDLYNLKVKETPIIPTKDNTPYSGTTGRRDIIFIDGWYYMVYEVSTDKSNVGFRTAQWSHMFARSKDMLKWETMSNPLLIQKDATGKAINGFGYDGPCWVIIDNHIYVYFRETVDGQNWTTRAELTLK